MLSEGAVAPAVELPGYVDEERERVDLAEYLGEGIVVLAFYPADFNPACSMQSSDLGDLDLFTMQKDVSVFGISPDSTFSHEAFAERFSLRVPLLSDVDGEATAAYGVARETETGESLPKRAVFVVDHHGEVRYAWATDDLAERIDVDPVKRAVGDIGGDETALERYRAGYDHYVAGREAFAEAMAEYEDREWLPARGGFDDAEPSFTTAADHLDTAVRFAETPAFEAVVDRAEEKADTLQHAANWLSDSADALGSGRGKQGNDYREDADRLLDTASDLPEPPEPDLFTLTDDGIELDDEVVVDPDAAADAAPADGRTAAADTDLDIDEDALDAAVAADGESTDGDHRGDPVDGSVDGADDSAIEGDTVEGDLEMDLSAVESDGDGHEDGSGDGGGSAIEGDTVEGDLEMDLDAIDDAGGETDGETDVGPTDDASTDGDHGGDAGSETADETAGAAGSGAATESGAAIGTGATAGSEATAGPDTGERTESTVGRGGSDPAETTSADERAETNGDDSADEAVDDDQDEVEELELADPTEADDDDDDDDERSNWNIPGR